MRVFRFTVTAVFTACLVICLFMIFKLSFGEKIKAHKIVNEVITMEIDSSRSYIEYSGNVVSIFYIGGKYRIDVEHTIFKPFQSKEKYGFCIKDKDANIVASNFFSRNMYQSDVDKLSLYLQTHSK